MKTFSKIFIAILFIIQVSFSETPEKFSRIRIFIPNHAALQQVWSAGIDYEGVTGKVGGYMEFVAARSEMEHLNAKQISYEVVVDDLAKLEASKLAHHPVNALGFGYGSMGGYYTLEEVIQQLDSMRILYPNIISERESIGTTREGRAMWVVKISDNPSANEADEPQVLYTALHHAREPEGMMALMYYMWWMLENYDSNPEAAYLVNNRQMYFLPVMNVDGYKYNETTNPDGGGYWRKNRRNNGDGTYGVDPNRNYGPDYMWNASNGGSGTTTGDDTYRGTAPFSEPENQAMDRFMRAHTIKACLNYHTYGNYLISPFGYLSHENSDSLIYRDMQYVMTSYNNFTSGTDLQTVNYATRGNSDDYMFGDTTKFRTWTMTPEVGTTGFWPTTEEIFPLAISCFGQNRYLAYVAGQTTRLRKWKLNNQESSTTLLRGSEFTLNLTMRNFGFTDASDISISVTPTPLLQFSGMSQQLGLLTSLKDSTLNFSGSVPVNASEGKPFMLYITSMDSTGYSWMDSIPLVIGAPTVIFSDSASNGISKWSSTGGWNTTTSSYHTGPASFTDSPNGPYPSSANSILTQTTQVSLVNYDYAELSYWTKWALEPTWDFASVEVSTNNGTTWLNQRTPIMQLGDGRSSAQPNGTYGYDGYTPGLTFIRQQINLTPYLGKQIRVRFKLASDGGEERDGIYVDDIKILGYKKSVDSAVIIVPSEISFSGLIGSDNTQQVKIYNQTANSVSIAIAETSINAKAKTVSTISAQKGGDISSMVKKLAKSVSKHTQGTLAKTIMPPIFYDNKGWTTFITDRRGDNLIRGADVYRMDYQKLVLPQPFNTVLQFRVFMNAPDSNVIGVLSVDADQNYATGVYPSPQGIGSPANDVGAEYQVICVLSSEVAESLGIGSIPFVAVISTATDSIVGIPLPMTVSQDSVMTASFTLPVSYFNDPASVNISSFFTSYRNNPFPDYAPDFGHGVIGTENGVSWLNESVDSLIVASGDSATIDIRALAAKAPGTYLAGLNFAIANQPQAFVPVHLEVIAPPPPHLQVTPLAIHDSVTNNDSMLTPITISNSGEGMLYFALFDSVRLPWLTVQNPVGQLVQNQSTDVIINVDSMFTSDSLYTTNLILSCNDPGAPQKNIPVSVYYRYVLSVNQPANTLPKEVSLKQNYPNPFNPSTTIEFALPKAMHITLKVYSVLGEEVTTLANGIEQAGFHQRTFNASTLPSGLYFYRLVAEPVVDKTALHNQSFMETKKLLLMK